MFAINCYLVCVVLSLLVCAEKLISMPFEDLGQSFNDDVSVKAKDSMSFVCHDCIFSRKFKVAGNNTAPIDSAMVSLNKSTVRGNLYIGASVSATREKLSNFTLFFHNMKIDGIIYVQSVELSSNSLVSFSNTTLTSIKFVSVIFFDSTITVQNCEIEYSTAATVVVSIQGNLYRSTLRLTNISGTGYQTFIDYNLGLMNDTLIEVHNTAVVAQVGFLIPSRVDLYNTIVIVRNMTVPNGTKTSASTLSVAGMWANSTFNYFPPETGFRGGFYLIPSPKSVFNVSIGKFYPGTIFTDFEVKIDSQIVLLSPQLQLTFHGVFFKPANLIPIMCVNCQAAQVNFYDCRGPQLQKEISISMGMNVSVQVSKCEFSNLSLGLKCSLHDVFVEDSHLFAIDTVSQVITGNFLVNNCSFYKPWAALSMWIDAFRKGHVKILGNRLPLSAYTYQLQQNAVWWKIDEAVNSTFCILNNTFSRQTDHGRAIRIIGTAFNESSISIADNSCESNASLEFLELRIQKFDKSQLIVMPRQNTVGDIIIELVQCMRTPRIVFGPFVGFHGSFKAKFEKSPDFAYPVLISFLSSTLRFFKLDLFSADNFFLELRVENTTIVDSMEIVAQKRVNLRKFYMSDVVFQKGGIDFTAQGKFHLLENSTFIIRHVFAESIKIFGGLNLLQNAKLYIENCFLNSTVRATISLMLPLMASEGNASFFIRNNSLITGPLGSTSSGSPSASAGISIIPVLEAGCYLELSANIVQQGYNDTANGIEILDSRPYTQSPSKLVNSRLVVRGNIVTLKPVSGSTIRPTAYKFSIFEIINATVQIMVTSATSSHGLLNGLVVCHLHQPSSVPRNAYSSDSYVLIDLASDDVHSLEMVVAIENVTVRIVDTNIIDKITVDSPSQVLSVLQPAPQRFLFDRIRGNGVVSFSRLRRLESVFIHNSILSEVKLQSIVFDPSQPSVVEIVNTTFTEYGVLGTVLTGSPLFVTLRKNTFNTKRCRTPILLDKINYGTPSARSRLLISDCNVTILDECASSQLPKAHIIMNSLDSTGNTTLCLLNNNVTRPKDEIASVSMFPIATYPRKLSVNFTKNLFLAAASDGISVNCARGVERFIAETNQFRQVMTPNASFLLLRNNTFIGSGSEKFLTCYAGSIASRMSAACNFVKTAANLRPLAMTDVAGSGNEMAVLSCDEVPPRH